MYNQQFNNGYVDNNQMYNQPMNNGYVDNNQMYNQQFNNGYVDNNQMYNQPINNGYVDNNQESNIQPEQINNISNQNMDKQEKIVNKKIKEKKEKQQSNPSNSNKNGVRVFLIILIILLTISLGYFGYRLYLSCTKGETNNSYQSNISSLVNIKKDGKYGYVSNNKFVISAKYDEATPFYGNYARVVENIEKGEKQYEVIDTKGNIMFKSSSTNDIRFYDKYNVWVINGSLYDYSLNKKSSDEVKVSVVDVDGYFKWTNEIKKQAGIMDLQGNITYTYNFKENENDFSFNVSKNNEIFKENYCVVKANKKNYGVVNCDNGKVIYDYTDYTIVRLDNNIFKATDKFGYEEIKFYVQNDKIVYKTDDKYITMKFDEQKLYIPIKESNNIISYIDVIKGEVVDSEPKTEKRPGKWESYSKYTVFSCGDKYGIKENENTIINCEYTELVSLNLNLYKLLESNGKKYIIGIKDNKSYLLDLNIGNEVTSFDSIKLNILEKSPFIYYTNESNRKIVYSLFSNKSMEVSSSVEYYPNYIKLKEDGVIKYYNTNLNVVY